MARVFSGVKPTSDVPHLGNYLGAFRHWVEMQHEHESLICVVDLHSITVPPWEPELLARRTRQITASLIAVGIEPDVATVFAQSDVPDHVELSWLLTCISRMGELGRMTQFKEKSRGQEGESVSAGLFMYPVLMAADVLVYRANLVPIGDDQKQHLELMRDIAERFNRTFGETFPIPDPVIQKHGARIMSLDDSTRKMDKSAERPQSVIWLTDSADEIRSKIGKAVTDSGRDVAYGPDKPALSNLIDIYALISATPVDDLVDRFAGKGYAEFKSALSEELIAFLEPIQKKYSELVSDPGEIDRILDLGAAKAAPLASRTLADVRDRMGFRRPGKLG